ncbi:MAG: hypothetical protein Ta2F_13630 [Termitinemataceae bacterium]|nr:MAG: hypothetical protein Ta2F_13630 [Termitinemataceae bacterium]
MQSNHAIKNVICCLFCICLCAAVLNSCKTVQITDNTPLTEEIKPASSLAFSALPPEIQKYLNGLRTAFKEHNNDYLNKQGELFYEMDVKPKFTTAQYIAMLYRIGPYAKDSTWQIPAFFLDLNKVRSLEWIDFSEQGPVLNVNAKLILYSGDPLPCRIMLMWRLKEPKVIGTYP